MLLQSDLISASSFVSCTFSFRSLSFSSRSSAGARDGEELDDITCSSPELDGDIIGIAVGIAVNGIGEGTATVAVAIPAAVGDGDGEGVEIFRR